MLASGLCTNDTLQTLYLDGYPIGDEGAVAFALLLQENSTLVHINLVNCNINSSGACQMATAICMNGTLQHLDLSQNPIGVKGAASFAEMLHQNKSLKALCLSDDTICEEGTQKLVDSLTENTTLESLWLSPKYQSRVADRRVSFVSYGGMHIGSYHTIEDQECITLMDTFCLFNFFLITNFAVISLTIHLDCTLLCTILTIIIVNYQNVVTTICIIHTNCTS